MRRPRAFDQAGIPSRSNGKAMAIRSFRVVAGNCERSTIATLAITTSAMTTYCASRPASTAQPPPSATATR